MRVTSLIGGSRLRNTRLQEILTRRQPRCERSSGRLIGILPEQPFTQIIGSLGGPLACDADLLAVLTCRVGGRLPKLPATEKGAAAPYLASIRQKRSQGMDHYQVLSKRSASPYFAPYLALFDLFGFIGA